MLYACMMGNYDGLYLPLMVAGFAFSAPFFLLTVRTAQKKGQKASLVRYVAVALAAYTVVLVLLLVIAVSVGVTQTINNSGIREKNTVAMTVGGPVRPSCMLWPARPV